MRIEPGVRLQIGAPRSFGRRWLRLGALATATTPALSSSNVVRQAR
jgi:hypothetical protein